jgi:hypothetical protein
VVPARYRRIDQTPPGRSRARDSLK